MKIKWLQDGKEMISEFVRLELANNSGDFLVVFSDIEGDWLIIDRENFIMVWEV